MTDGAPRSWPGRLGQIDTALNALGLDGLVVSTPTNIAYLTGFRGSSGLLLLTRGRRALLVDGRYLQAARDLQRHGLITALDIVSVETRYDVRLGQEVEAARLARVGFEAGHVTISGLRDWQAAAAQAEWVATDDVVETLRLVKDASEIATLRKAAALLSRVAADAIPEILRPGVTELAAARAIDASLLAAGFSRPAFATIVAFGANSSLPHATPTGRKLVAGDPALLDFGGVLDGYCVDLTRMAVAGNASFDLTRVFEAVRDAQAAAIRAVKPGAETTAVDAAARDVLEGNGLGDAFVHATGHGLGLEVHEGPRVARADTRVAATLRPGMVITIEPGAYLAGQFGVRLEDDVLVTPDGCEVLTTAPLDLRVI